MSFDNTGLDYNVISEFWKLKSLRPEGRWTSPSMLKFEIETLNEVIMNFKTLDILDLGSGHGALSKSLVETRGTLLAVDNQIAYQESFKGNLRASFHLSDVQKFKSSTSFDLILLFGVVTYMDIANEELTLATISSMLKSEGLAIIKHQCADVEGFIFNGFSFELDAQYSSRYPSRDEQRERLLSYFSSVQEIEYPLHLKNHPNSTHIMFICKKR